jgi:anti-sigma factor RsiW
MIKFSFRPSRWSVLPDIAASVRTRVVSWKDADAMQACLASDLGKGVVGNPNFANLTSRDFEVLGGPTTSSGRPVAASLTATASLASYVCEFEAPSKDSVAAAYAGLGFPYDAIVEVEAICDNGAGQVVTTDV